MILQTNGINQNWIMKLLTSTLLDADSHIIFLLMSIYLNPYHSDMHYTCLLIYSCDEWRHNSYFCGVTFFVWGELKNAIKW